MSPSIGPISATPSVPALWASAANPMVQPTTGTLAANYAVFNLLFVTAPITVTKVYFYVNVASGNIDYGIYEFSGGSSVTRLASTGSTACPAAGQRNVALTAAVTLLPGKVYYAAYASDNGTVALSKNILTFNWMVVVGGVSVFANVQVNGLFPLVDNPSFAQFTTSGSTLHVPVSVFAP